MTTPTAPTQDRHLHYRAEHGSYYLYSGPTLVRMVDHLTGVAFAYDTDSGRIVHHGDRASAQTYADRANAVFKGSWTIGVASFEDGFPIDEINAALKSGSVWDIVKTRPALAGAIRPELILTRAAYHKLSLEEIRNANRIVVDGVVVKSRDEEAGPEAAAIMASHPLLRTDRTACHTNDGA